MSRVVTTTPLTGPVLLVGISGPLPSIRVAHVARVPGGNRVAANPVAHTGDRPAEVTWSRWGCGDSGYGASSPLTRSRSGSFDRRVGDASSGQARFDSRRAPSAPVRRGIHREQGRDSRCDRSHPDHIARLPAFRLMKAAALESDVRALQDDAVPMTAPTATVTSSARTASWGRGSSSSGSTGFR